LSPDIRVDSAGLVELCANPEFLREGTAIRDFEEPPFTVLGTDSAAAETTLRSLYSKQSAQVFVLKPKEALMVKYASNAFHSLNGYLRERNRSGLPAG